MSRKIIPQSFRLYKEKNWNSQWMANKQDYANILNIDLNIRKFIPIVIEKSNLNMNFMGMSLKQNFNNYSIYIFVNSFSKKKYASDKLKDKENFYILKKNIENTVNSFLLKSFINKKFKAKVYFIKLTSTFFGKEDRKVLYQLCNFLRQNFLVRNLKVNLFLLGLMVLLKKDAQLFSKIISNGLKKNPKHIRYLFGIKKILNKFFNSCSSFKGYRVQIKGRINGRGRAKKRVIQEGQIPLNSISKKINYGFSEAITPFGICSVKVWFFFDN